MSCFKPISPHCKYKMKTRPNFSTTYLCAMLIAGCSLFFQSCTQSNDIQPKSVSSNTVTVKIKSQYPGTSGNTEQPSKHFRLTSIGAVQKVLLDTNIASNFTYTFKSQQPGLSLIATITAGNPFTSDIEIDVNGTMQAYHGGSCPGTEYDMTDNISF